MLKNLLIAGGNGFLGRHLHEAFGTKPSSLRLDFTIEASAMAAVSGMLTAINAAGKISGITGNANYPADHYWANAKIGFNLMNAARLCGVKKFVQIGTVCSYPRRSPIPTRECDFWYGAPEETNGAYGLAKRSLVDYGQALTSQHGFNVIHPILANLYGPGDHYEPSRAHVIPDLIRRFSDAVDNGDKLVTLLGSGRCSREFLYVKDAARAIKFLTAKYDSPEIINVASGREVTIKELAAMLASLCKFKGSIKWDTSRPDGQPRRRFDTSKINAIGWKAKTSLEEGLMDCVQDYKKGVLA